MQGLMRSVVFVLAMLSSCAAAAQTSGVFVNEVQLNAATLRAIRATYQTTVPAGHYWYDSASGLWGRRGGPTLGRIDAGLQIGGPLRVNASNGDTAVFVNGRRLPGAELSALQQLVGPVQPGRYWFDAYGNAGYEGGPVLVNLFAAHRQRSGDGDWTKNTLFGNFGGNSKCSYYSHPDGPSVMIGDC